MIGLSNEELAQVSFPDCDVIAFDMDLDASRLNIVMDEAFVDAPHPRWLGQTAIELSEWKSIQARAFDHVNRVWLDLDSSRFDSLKDIAEFESQTSSTALRGFGKSSGKWTEYKFEGAQIKIYVAEI